MQICESTQNKLNVYKTRTETGTCESSVKIHIRHITQIDLKLFNLLIRQADLKVDRFKCVRI